MRHFRKGNEPARFRAWKTAGNDNWTPSYDELRDPEKSDLHGALIAEQHEACCYCGRPITESQSHIEHFRPQNRDSGFEHLRLEYGNLHASCNGRATERHCGHAKGNWFDENLAISPLDPTCEGRFRYDLNGKAGPQRETDDGAVEMIARLNLNASALADDRARALRVVFDPEFIESVTDQELRTFRRVYFSSEGAPLESFAHVLVRFAEELTRH